MPPSGICARTMSAQTGLGRYLAGRRTSSTKQKARNASSSTAIGSQTAGLRISARLLRGNHEQAGDLAVGAEADPTDLLANLEPQRDVDDRVVAELVRARRT